MFRKRSKQRPPIQLPDIKSSSEWKRLSRFPASEMMKYQELITIETGRKPGLSPDSVFYDLVKESMENGELPDSDQQPAKES